MNNLAKIIFGELVRKYRLRNNKSQADLSFNAEMNPSYLSTVECGNSIVTITKFIDICRALGMSPAIFLEEYIYELNKVLDKDHKIKQLKDIKKVEVDLNEEDLNEEDINEEKRNRK